MLILCVGTYDNQGKAREEEMTTAAIIGIGLASLLIGVAVFAVWAVYDHDKEYQQDYKAGEENMGDW